MKKQQEFSYKQCIEEFVHPAMSILSSSAEPRISGYIKRILHFTDQAKTRDWYLYLNYTEIRVYGCKLAPYKLPKYLPMRIFVLEYTRKMLNSDYIHFVVEKKKSQFWIKTQVGPFICNTRSAREEADKMLKVMKFTLSFTWSYDPRAIISKLRVENKTTPYIHTPRPEIEKYVNQP